MSFLAHKDTAGRFNLQQKLEELGLKCDGLLTYNNYRLTRLTLCCCSKHPVAGDGNCQFHAVGDQLRRSHKEIISRGYEGLDERAVAMIKAGAFGHKALRRLGVTWLRENQDLQTDTAEKGDSVTVKGHQALAASVDDETLEAWDTYLNRMQKHGEYGDEGTLVALAALFHLRINIITTHLTPQKSDATEITPPLAFRLDSNRLTTITLCHHPDQSCPHYDSTCSAVQASEAENQLEAEERSKETAEPSKTIKESMAVVFTEDGAHTKVLLIVGVHEPVCMLLFKSDLDNLIDTT